MNPANRRNFLVAATTLGAGAIGASTVVSEAAEILKSPPALVHHVFFWLKRPESQEDLALLLKGLRTLAGIETVRGIHIGVPAATEQRGVVDASYDASELLFFDDVAGQNTYQVHPIHRKFVADCEHLWERVVVYDVVAAKG